MCLADILTNYHTIQNDIRNAGGTRVDREVVHDGRLVTSRQPPGTHAFNREMMQLVSREIGGRHPKLTLADLKDIGGDGGSDHRHFV